MDCAQANQVQRITTATALSPADSLWKRAPTKTQDGTALCDFMLLVPGLNKRSENQISARVGKISAVLLKFDNTVVFADLNMKLNLLWVSYKPNPGTSIAIARAIQDAVPETKMVAMKFD